MSFEEGELSGLHVIYKDRANFESKLASFKADGASALSVISDFDFTLSRYWQADGSSRSASCHMVLENSDGLLPAEYVRKAQELQHHYYPIEKDPTIGKEEKYKEMEAWVTKHNLLFQEINLTEFIVNQAVANAMESGNFALRGKLQEMFEVLEKADIPLLIFSAGISNVLESALQKTIGVLPRNMDVASNKLLFDESGVLTGFSEPVLHVMNKSCHAFLETVPFFKRLDNENRKNLFVFGDSMGDLKMIEGLDVQPENVIKIGFLNPKDHEPLLPTYLEAGETSYDIVILGDPPLDVHLQILQNIVNAEP